jgi:DNA-binding CsgD family transcriptional regulator
MEHSGRLDGEALGYVEPEAVIRSEPEVLFILALAGVVQLLRPYLVRLLAHSNSGLGLTRREIEILCWVAAGRTNAETGAILGIAPGTVKKHLDRIYEKLGVGTRTEAAIAAIGVPYAWAVRRGSGGPAAAAAGPLGREKR